MNEDIGERKRLYKTSRWLRLRQEIIARDAGRCQWNNCGTFLTGKQHEPNTGIAHHIKPHKGDAKLFWDKSNLMAVCKACHDGPIQAVESGGTIVGVDGWPVTPPNKKKDPLAPPDRRGK